MRQRARDDDAKTRATLQRASDRWSRWIAGVVHGPLADLADLPSARDPSAWSEHWRSSVHEIAARIVLAGVREGLVGGHRNSGALVIELDETDLSLPLAHEGAFGLHAPALDGPLDPRLADPLAIADELCAHAGLDAEGRARVVRELLDSIVNLAQARLAGALRQEIAHHPTRPPGAPIGDPRLSDPEHFVIDGHGWHPMTRTRLGLSRAAVLRCAPEQLATTLLRCVDVESELARVAGDWLDESRRWFGNPAPGFVRVPIHPEAPANLARLFPALLDRGAIRPVPHWSLPCRSLLSLRTVALAPTRHLKLACPVQTTSTRRQVSPMSVHNGPLISGLVARIQAADPDTRALRLLPEIAGAGLEPDRVEPAGELGAIVRALPELPDDEGAWVCAAIAERWPGGDELVLERACAGYPGARLERLAALLDDWLELLVPPALKLFSAHGVALELHLQNTLAHVVDGRLRAIWVRDLGGIRVHAPRLRALPFAQPSFAPDSFILTEDLDEARGKLEHTVFHAHLSHLFATAGRLGLDEARSWARARRLVDACYARWAASPGADARLRRQLAADHAALLRPEVRAKALLSMRLHQRSSDYDYTLVPNALAAAGAELTDAPALAPPRK